MEDVKVWPFISSMLLVIFPLPAQAQLLPDDSLGAENSRVNATASPNGAMQYQIDQGATRGPNLFHSFSSFDIQSGEAAYFTPAAGIERIFSRVTGGTPSQLDGVLGVQGSNADLFLLNPQGLIFGPNARLALSGSFIGSSAQAVQFHDGASFDAAQPDPSIPLAVSVPLGLQLGEQTGVIQVQGTGHQLRAADPYLAPFIPESPYRSLQVLPQRTLALLGGDMALNGGSIQAPGGRIELGSVAQAGLVELQPDSQGWSLTYPELTQFGSLLLTNQASVEVGGVPFAGNLQVQAGIIGLEKGSIIYNTNLNPETGGTTTINAAQSLTVSGFNSDINVPTAILQDQFGLGQSGAFRINSPHLMVQEGAVIGSRNYGLRRGGELRLEVDKLQVEGVAEQQPDAFSRIGTVTFSSGRGGDMRINAKEIDVNTGGFVGSATGLNGEQGGDVWVMSDRITIKGASPIGLLSVLGASHVGNSGRAGNSGNLNIDSRILELFDGGTITTSSVASGDAGNLSISAEESITIRGRDPIKGLPSSISSVVITPAEALQQIFGLPAIPSGKGGNILIQTPVLKAEKGARVSVSNFGIGKAGNINIYAESIRLQDQGGLDAFTLAGDGGNIQIQSKKLVLIDNSRIEAVALDEGNTGNGGNISLDSSIILGVGDSDVLAQAQQGKGGNIDIKTQALLGLKLSPQLTPNSDISASSNLGVDGTVQVELLTTNPISEPLLPEMNLRDTGQLIAVECQSHNDDQFTISGKGGLPAAPTSVLALPGLWSESRTVPRPKSNQPHHTPLISPEPQHSQQDSIQETATWKRLPSGEIQLLAQPHNSFSLNQVKGC